MDKETLNKMAEEIADIDLNRLCGIAPFIEKETMDKIIDRYIQNGSVDADGIVGIAPFLSKSTIQKVVVYFMEHGQTEKLVAINKKIKP